MKRNHYNLSFKKKSDKKFGFIYPEVVQECVAGDVFRGGAECVLRCVNPPTAPITDNIKYHMHYFFVPSRILDDHFVRNMTGTKTGDVHGNFKAYSISDIQKMNELLNVNVNNNGYKDGLGSSRNVIMKKDYFHSTEDIPTKKTYSDSVLPAYINGEKFVTNWNYSNQSLLDYMGLDVMSNLGWKSTAKINVGAISAYYMIYNFYYRNPEVQKCVAPIWDYLSHDVDWSDWSNYSDSPVPETLHRYETLVDEEGCEFALPREVDNCYRGLMIHNWQSDYFTDVTLNAQRGTAPKVPVNFDVSKLGLNLEAGFTKGIGIQSFNAKTINDTDGQVPSSLYDTNQVYNVGKKTITATGTSSLVNPNTYLFGKDELNAIFDSELTASISRGFGSIDITDLRTALTIQHFMEKNNSAFKWSDFLIEHFGTCPNDETLDKPLYLGGFSDSIYTSEVVSTAETDTPLGAQAGHMLGVGGKKRSFTYRCKEHGWILGLMYIMPERNYESGVHKQFLRKNYLDMYFPCFAGLGQQAIKSQELCAMLGTGTGKTPDINWAFTERFGEMKSNRNMICGSLRHDIIKDYEFLGPGFDVVGFNPRGEGYNDEYHNYAIGETYYRLPNEGAELNSNFLTCLPQLNDIFAGDYDSPFVCSTFVRLDAYRGIPRYVNPGVAYV